MSDINEEVYAICQRYLDKWQKEFTNYEAMIEKCCGEKLILNNEIINAQISIYNNRKPELTEWELFCGDWFDEYGNFMEIYQYYIISEHGAEMLRDYTDEIVQYNPGLGLYLLCVTHWGTSWDYVPSNWKLYYRDYNPTVNDVDGEEEEDEE